MFAIMLQVVKIYYSFTNEVVLNSSIVESICSVRKNYIDTILDDKRKTQSILVWKLLEYALFCDFPSVKTDFFVCNGKWKIKNDLVKFSLSHSFDAIAVAVSTNDVGVDVEKCSTKILKAKRKFEFDKNLTENDLILDLTKKWTEKESLFKCEKGNNFSTEVVADKFGDKFVITACGCDECFEFINVDFYDII